MENLSITLFSEGPLGKARLFLPFNNTVAPTLLRIDKRQSEKSAEQHTDCQRTRG